MPARECSRTTCSRPAVSSLTFVYVDATAVLGPLSRTREPHAYDLCSEHATRMTAPRGWDLLRVAGGGEVSDDLVALADAVRQRPAPTDQPVQRTPEPPSRTGREQSRSARDGEESGRHLHVVRNTND